MDYALLGAIIAFVVFIGGIMHRSVEGRREAVRQSELFYLQHYWAIMYEFPSGALVDRMSPRPEDAILGELLTDEEIRKLCLLYLRLSEDECELRRRGAVSDETWKQWVLGMRHHMARWPVRNAWYEVRDSSHPDIPHKPQFEHLRQVEAHGGRYDFCSMNVIRRAWHGLRPGWWWRWWRHGVRWDGSER
ncbi:hypothetical protein [Streptomyces apricus]|uniref:Uncharacterized protein n=1 Tax=Streptomyces apricus TaxID=1828112 RepID=A0A5B0A6M0_9ACTN|nr:hypothetical protein [Streptomyces apricus]KAA0924255.1 hypothetical protein FGF04_33070 [Streptomyces apricus]